ncbi:sigma-E processing peptidase SpoIIGA [Bacillus sp. CGMCC 1.16607]|uniref:sigma-E processing peptidase SpoIIGA n=1 Tax=Bacillus sp. CGMCC 1.16607 TaxID=3351842 RepID=UPI00363500D7
MTVYLDVIWFLNFLFDSLLLYLTSIMLKRHVTWWRIFLGGIVGSLIIFLSFSPLASIAGNPLVKLGFSFVMILATFGYKRIRFFLKALMLLYLSTFLTGGTLIGVHYFIKFDNQLTSDVFLASLKGFGDPISWLFVMIGFPVAWYFSSKGIEKMEMINIQFEQLVDVHLSIQDLQFTIKGLVDSGNQLYDPITKSPVMIVSIHQVKEIFPSELIEMGKEPEAYLFGNKQIPSEWESRVKIIPCRVVGQDHQLIIAFKPDSLKIGTDRGEFNVTKALVSLTLQQLSADEAFQCIVHPKMMTNASAISDSTKVS